MIPTQKHLPLPEALSRSLLDVSRALEYALEHPCVNDIVALRARSIVTADAARLCRVIARTLCVDPEETLLSVVLQFTEGTSDEY